MKDYPSALHCSLHSLRHPTLSVFPRRDENSARTRDKRRSKGRAIEKTRACVRATCAPILLHPRDSFLRLSPVYPIFSFLFSFSSGKFDETKQRLENLRCCSRDLGIDGLESYTFFITFSFIVDRSIKIGEKSDFRSLFKFISFSFSTKKGRKKHFLIVSIFLFPNNRKYLGRVFSLLFEGDIAVEWVYTGADGNRVVEITRCVVKMDNYCANRRQKKPRETGHGKS